MGRLDQLVGLPDHPVVSRLFKFSCIAIGLALVVFAVANAVELRRDQLDLRAASECYLPVTGDRSCVYYLDGTVVDVDTTTRGRRREPRQTLQVRMYTRDTMTVTIYTEPRVSEGDRVTIGIWDRQAVTVEHEGVRLYAGTLDDIFWPLILPGAVGLFLSACGMLLLLRQSVAYAFVQVPAVLWWGFAALAGRWTMAALVAFGIWIALVIIAARGAMSRSIRSGRQVLEGLRRRNRLGRNPR